MTTINKCKTCKHLREDHIKMGCKFLITWGLCCSCKSFTPISKKVEKKRTFKQTLALVKKIEKRESAKVKIPKFRVFMTTKSKGCKHTQFECLDCGSIASTIDEISSIDKEEFIRLAKKVAKSLVNDIEGIK